MSTAAPAPTSFFTLETGTPVVDRFGLPVGKVEDVRVAYGEYFDGIVVSTEDGERFIDAPEVGRIDPGRIALEVPVHDVLAADPDTPPAPRTDEATDADRAAVEAALTLGYLNDLLTLEELDLRIGRAQTAADLPALDALVADLL